MSRSPGPALTNSTPVFAVRDVGAAQAFYRDRLGFSHKWTWGEPPTFGCVGLGRHDIFFSQQPELAARVEGHQHFFWCDDVNAMHAQHAAAGAPIISAIQDKPWGVREYTVRDLSGYHLRFSGAPDYTPPASATDRLPEHIELVLRHATVEEYAALLEAVGWNKDPATTAPALAHSLFCVVAADRRDGRCVGMVRVCGDGRYYTIWDVMVLPAYQGQKIGSALMERAVAHLRATAPAGAIVFLFTGKPAFYERFGFAVNAGGMSLGL